MSADKRYPTIPENADKILFAEDIVNHILSRLDLPLLSSGIANHRAKIHNAFGPEVRLAANYYLDTWNDDTTRAFERILKEKPIVTKDFIKYINHLKSRFVFYPNGLKARYFLSLCVRFSMISGKFFQLGILDAPNLAFQHILSMIEDIDMIEEGGWNALNTICTDLAQFYIDINEICLTPTSDHGSGGSRSSGSDNENNFADHSIEEEDVSTCEEHLRVFIDSSSSPEGPVTPSKQIEKTDEEKSGSILNFSGDIKHSVPTGSSEGRNSMVTYHSSVVTSKEDGISLKIIRKEQNQRPSCSYSKESGNCSKKYETYVQAADDIVPFDKPLTERHYDILGSQLNEHHKPNSDDGKFQKNSKALIYSDENISREYNIFTQNIRRNQNEDSSGFYWKESDSNSKTYKKDVQTADDINSLSQQLTDERSAIFSLSVNEIPKKDSAQDLKISSSDNQTAGSMKTSSTTERCRVQISNEESGRRKKAFPKKRNVFASKH